MSIFGYSKEAAPVTDSLGGFNVPQTDVYKVTLGHVFSQRSTGGGTAITLLGKYEDGAEFKKVIYPTSAKSGTEKNTTTDKDGNVRYLADFLHFDAICLLALGKPASDMTTENKMVKIFDSEQKKELPKAVPTYTDLHGKEVKFALTRTLKTKQKKVGDKWIDTDETRTEQNLDKVFRAVDNKTVTEVTTQGEAEYMAAWLAKNQGKDKDQTTKQSGTAGAPVAADAIKPLF